MKYLGNWKNGKKTGYGVSYKKNGVREFCAYIDPEKEKALFGIYYDSDGSIKTILVSKSAEGTKVAPKSFSRTSFFNYYNMTYNA
jgi:hypothetical protein